LDYYSADPVVEAAGRELRRLLMTLLQHRRFDV